MVFITAQEILETVSMIRSENLDVRAVTMGISLDDCGAGESHRTAERIHAKIVRRAGRLVEVAAELQEKYGVPIVNRRVSVTPIADVVGSDDPQAYLVRGTLFLDQKRPREAAADASDAIRLAPSNADARVVRAQARLELGQFAEALADLDIALALAPGNETAAAMRAEVVARMRPSADFVR